MGGAAKTASAVINPVALIGTMLGGGGTLYEQNKGLNAQKQQLDEISKQKTPAATPPPTPTDTSPAFTAQDRARRLKALQFGFASTITGAGKTSTGTTGLLSLAGASPLKEKLGV